MIVLRCGALVLLVAAAGCDPPPVDAPPTSTAVASAPPSAAPAASPAPPAGLRIGAVALTPGTVVTYESKHEALVQIGEEDDALPSKTDLRHRMDVLSVRDGKVDHCKITVEKASISVGGREVTPPFVGKTYLVEMRDGKATVTDDKGAPLGAEGPKARCDIADPLVLERALAPGDQVAEVAALVTAGLEESEAGPVEARFVGRDEKRARFVMTLATAGGAKLECEVWLGIADGRPYELRCDDRSKPAADRPRVESYFRFATKLTYH